MGRRLLHRLHGGEQGAEESEDFQEFHETISDVNCDENRKPPRPQQDFCPMPGVRRPSAESIAK